MSPFTIVLSITLLAGSIQAGVIGGHYGGHLNANAESHDFSEGLAKSESSNYESLGSLGDHLQESHFPSDYGHDEASIAASEHIEYGGHEHFSQHESIGSYHDIHSDLHDFDSKPVPGINHGKGALSYSTTYEFKDPKP
ncbi:hypothetical protein FF38_03307 [Lucilia cuprina]|uniref:Uncharacterized protein n=1 Tax=Lucilia cuprina TaxID=7375 RepID=A0A0L0C278_LUCCU|nr:hypothetical protein CVS40_5424 [Lucilia cuprina]KNC26415.1 hypothetical protein FF38_03307 [Lucilia cuprina]